MIILPGIKGELDFIVWLSLTMQEWQMCHIKKGNGDKGT